jgi:hypothetical protein
LGSYRREVVGGNRWRGESEVEKDGGESREGGNGAIFKVAEQDRAGSWGQAMMIEQVMPVRLYGLEG